MIACALLVACSKPVVISDNAADRVSMETADDGCVQIRFNDAVEHYREQDSGTLCWAAGVQMVLSLMGQTDIPEQETLHEEHCWTMERFWTDAGLDIPDIQTLATQVPRNILDRGSDAATAWEIMDALAPGHTEKYQGRIVVSLSDIFGNSVGAGPPGMNDGDIVRCIASGEPILMSLTEEDEFSRHAYVVVGAEFTQSDRIEITRLDLLDSAGEKRVYQEPMAQIKHRIRFSATPTTARLAFENDLDWLARAGVSQPGVYVRNPIDELVPHGPFKLRVFGIDVEKPLQSYPIFGK